MTRQYSSVQREVSYGEAFAGRSQEGRRPPARQREENRLRENAGASVRQGTSCPARRSPEPRRECGVRPPSRDVGPRRPSQNAAVRREAQPRREAGLRRTVRLRRRRRIFLRRLAIGAWVLCALLCAVAFALGDASAAAERQKDVAGNLSGGAEERGPLSASVQGIPAEKFAEHPEWTENLLTPNEYSRPGEALEAVRSIFVHYTANPGTSAAQNRSYFEWQKDTHETSVSAHFIIGYEGEIIQCVPLDEIAYAVMTRNYDSVSIECCYLAEDGSFTQATYDSLISLLAWLVDAYGLDTGDILRHYDCGGKKCPVYYTEHEDAWEQLKKDVDNL